VALDAEHGVTIASPALYCVAFQVCLPQVIDTLQRPRFKNVLSVNTVRDHTDNRIDPTEGYVARSNVALAPGWLGSDVQFFRWTGEFSGYHLLRPRWVGAVAVRLGNFFRTITIDPQRSFLPPEERFYAGGSSTVRGYERNGMGPGLYVTDRTIVDEETGVMLPDTARAQFVPLGGTALALANAEVRFPSPFLSNILRLAAFVDAGAIGEGNFWDLGSQEWRVTPGAGMRLQTPVGPVRIDIGFDPHRRQPGPLFVTDAETGALIRVRESFRPAPRGFFERFRIHAAVGQAF
jgi:outer membrane protein insertion porin family